MQRGVQEGSGARASAYRICTGNELAYGKKNSGKIIPVPGTQLFMDPGVWWEPLGLDRGTGQVGPGSEKVPNGVSLGYVTAVLVLCMRMADAVPPQRM